jgi:hypothetical protein
VTDATAAYGICPKHGMHAGGPCAECAKAAFSCARHGQRYEDGCLDCAAAITLNGLPDVQARFTIHHALIMELRDQVNILESRIADLEQGRGSSY